MTEYIKMIIVAIFTGFTAPLPVSSSAHFNFLSNVVGIAAEGERLSLFYNGFMFVFAAVIILIYRKIFIGCLKAAFVSKKDEAAYNAAKTYRSIFKNILFSLLPTLVLFVPISKDKLFMDLLDNFMNLNSLILAGFACVITSMVLVIALWYTRKSRSPKGTTNIKTAVRLSVYQLPCYIIPGFSHVAAGTVNLLISDVKIKTFLGEFYVYLAPSLLLVSLVKVCRSFIGGVLIDPIMLIIGAIFFGLAAFFVIKLTSKINIRRLFAYFSVYSFVFGIFIAVTSFFIN